jgi:hypothetical protein
MRPTAQVRRIETRGRPLRSMLKEPFCQSWFLVEGEG